MNAPVRKVALTLLLVFLLPAAFYTVYELNSLSESEKELSRVFENQLDAILFSVNQYADDVARSWTLRIRTSLEGENLPWPGEFLAQQAGLEAVFVTGNHGSSLRLPYLAAEADSLAIQAAIAERLAGKADLFQRLHAYQEQNYYKLEPLLDSAHADRILLLSAYQGKNERGFFGLVLDSRAFIRAVMGPRIQAIAGEDFLLAITGPQDLQPIFATDSLPAHSPNLRQLRDLWLFPGYQLGIQLKGQTIEQAVLERARADLLSLLALDAVLLLGVILAFRSIRRELDLAQAKSDFVSNVSHEIRTPLALISMFAETLEMDRVRDEARKQEYYQIIAQETRRLGGIVNKILSFSKMEAGRRTYDLKPLDLNDLASRVLETYAFHLQQQGFSSQQELKENLPPIMGDEEALSEALINLLDNAMKYSEDQKELVLRSGKQGKEVWLEIQDQGIGIPEPHQKAIFDKFFRVPQGDLHNTKGTGLGLTLVHHIIKAHGGRITLQSAPGKGSSFRLWFPAKT